MSFASQAINSSSLAPLNSSNLKVIVRIRAPKTLEVSKDKRKASQSSGNSSPATARNYTSIRVRNRSNSRGDLASPSRTYQSVRNASKESSRSRSAHGKSTSNKSSSGLLLDDKKYCIFTTKERSNLVIATENGVPGKVINEQLQDVQDLKYFNSIMSA
mmetsp:Transcript_30795/g.30288  ORF Transcript_30795/g.30288 Transcript_30795/m.30288 type:complete len:159 (+) Transcript_30795:29-505(+)